MAKSRHISQDCLREMSWILKGILHLIKKYWAGSVVTPKSKNTWYGTFKIKKNAEVIARQLRKQDFLTKITKDNGGWSLWYSKRAASVHYYRYPHW